MWSYTIDKSKDSITVYQNNTIFCSVWFGYYYPEERNRIDKMICWVMDLSKQIMQQKPADLHDFMEEIVVPLLKELTERL